MTLEELVPSLELCQQLPKGAFEDSALVWVFDGDLWHVEARKTSFYKSNEMVQAPTLEEILAVTPAILSKYGDGYILGINFEPLQKGVFDQSAVTAALKLYLQWMRV